MDGWMEGWMEGRTTTICKKQASILTHATMKKQLQNVFQCILSKSNTCVKLDIWKEEISDCIKRQEFLLMDDVNVSQLEVTKETAFMWVLLQVLCAP